VVNSVTLSGIVVTPVMEHEIPSGAKYLSFRMKNERKRGHRMTETLYVRVNVYSESQKRMCEDVGLDQGDRVWVHGELMARKEGDDGKDVVEIKANQVDKTDKGD